MSLSFFIAWRYLFSKKSHNAINIISTIAVFGIALATAAMVCTMSVFNGFRDLIGTLYTTFDAQLVVQAAKSNRPLDATTTRKVLQIVRNHKQVQTVSTTLEENALILFQGHPLVVCIKGVDENFDKVTDIRSILYGSQRSFVLTQADLNYGIPGRGLMEAVGEGSFRDVQICAPRRGERINLSNPIESFSVEKLHNSGTFFEVNQRKYDDHYIITSLDFAQSLFEKEGQISRLEIRLRPSADTERVKEELRQRLGDNFVVLDRLEQQADVFRVMQLEKLIAYLFLTFIVLLACFNIVSSLSMLIIEKRNDAETLSHLGLSRSRIRNIFMVEGRLISLMGAVFGIVLGVILCYLQQQYGLIKMGSGNSFIVQSYPVSLHWQDLLIVFFTVLVVGFISVCYPVYALANKLLEKD